MAEIPIALQLYSIRDEMADDVPGTLRRVAEMGYDGVEFAGFFEHSAEELAEMCDDLGLERAGAHVPLSNIEGFALQGCIDSMVALDNEYIVVPGLPEENRESVEAWKNTAHIFTAAVEKVKQHNMKLGYHNHAHEFQLLEGEIPWDVFFDNVSDNVFGQLDIGHVIRGGQDPILYLKKYPGRSTTVHIKDYHPEREDILLGEGVADWDTIFSLCESTGGTEWYIIEQETYPVPPMEAVETCLRTAHEMLGR